MRVEHAIVINAPVEEVWALTVDIERWPALTPTVTSVARLDDGPLIVGSQARLKQPGQRPKVWTVIEMDEPTSFVWGTTMMWLRLKGCHTLTDVAGETHNALAVEITGFGSGLVGRLGHRALARTLATENDAFKQAAESATDQR